MRMNALVSSILATSLLSACAYMKTLPLTSTYDIRKGYRFDSLPLSATTPARNSEQLFVMLAFSGGGTRAAAMSYGVLSQLRNVKFHVDPATGQPIECAPTDSPRCKATERSLLDEVDVISSVSGGSFTSAYYALYGDSIFNRQSTFQDKFLYHRVQSDLVKEMVYRPRNWGHLRSRVEIAAEYHARNIFGDATFAQLERRPRPYLILNATDASTGARFEFSQEQFDMLCADLSKTPVARGVASSSAFPALLNSLTIDNYTAGNPCKYTAPTWEAGNLAEAMLNPVQYQRAVQQRAYRDPKRTHLHLLDGGLADNLGLRAYIQSLVSINQPDQTIDGKTFSGGFSLLRRITAKKVIKHVIVITVDARTNHPKDWDTKKAGPTLVSVVDASAGIPMGNFTSETLALMRAVVQENSEAFDSVSFRAASISLDGVKDDNEREYLNATGTNFELPAFTVNCLMNRSAQLLRETQLITARDSVETFPQFVTGFLHGTVTDAAVPAVASCNEQAGKKAIKANSHTLDVAVRYSTTQRDGDNTQERSGLGIILRVAKPNGIGASLGVTMPVFGISARQDNANYTLGRMRLYGLMAGPVYGQHLGRIELSGGLSAGYAFGNFRTSAAARTIFAQHAMSDMKTRATSTWLVKPNASIWYSLTNKVAITGSASYLLARPSIKFEGVNALPDRTLRMRAVQLSAGLGYRIF